jgi:hypothetical protein
LHSIAENPDGNGMLAAKDIFGFKSSVSPSKRDFSPFVIGLFPGASHASVGNGIPEGTLANHSVGAARPHSRSIAGKLAAIRALRLRA